MCSSDLTGAGEVDAVLFTSAPGAAEWLAEAQRAGAVEGIRRRAASGRLLLAAVGPITAGPLTEAGLAVHIAERGRLGSLVRSVVAYFGGGGAPAVATVAGRLELRSGGAILDGRYTPLSRAGAELLGLLVDAAGAVIPRERMQEALPRAGTSANAVEMAVARVREALGAPEVIKTVVKRGYRLNLEEDA